MFTIWIAVHRNLVFGLLCLLLWGFANYWYLRTDISRYRKARRPHTWTVDMLTKTSKGGKKVKH